MNGVAFEWTIKAGDLLTMGAGLVVAFGLFYKRGGVDADVRTAIKMLTKDFNEMKDDMRTFSKAIADLAVQRSEINMLIKWYDEMRRGVGRIE